MADLILDEWLWSDLSGENHKERQGEAFRLLLRMQDKNDRIVTVKGAEFDRKSWEFFRYTDQVRREISKFYQLEFRFNQNRVVSLDPAALSKPLDPAVMSRIKDDDKYLVLASLHAPGSTIITTDNDLHKILVENKIACLLRDEFLPVYLGS